MASEWTRCTVDDIKGPGPNALATGPFGSAISSRLFEGSGVPVIRGGNLSQDVGIRLIDDGLAFVSKEKAREFARSMVRRGDLVFTCWGTIDQVGLIDDRSRFPTYVVSNKQMKLTPDPAKVDSLYLYYLFSSPSMRETILSQGIGSSVPGFNLGQLRAIPLELPPLSEQRAIARILGTLDDKIELNRQMNETLEAMARALFKSWFVNFDPVRAKAEGRDPGQPQHIADLFPDSFEDSELGEIPSGWQLLSIEELTGRVAIGPFGSSIKVSTFVPEGIPVISGQHLHGTLLDDSEFNFVTPEHAEQLKRANVQRGDVVFTHAGNIGQVALIPETSRYDRYVISQRQFYLRCNLDVMSPLVIVLYFKTPQGQHRLLANTSSTGVPSISQPVSYLRQLKIVTAPQEVTRAFDSIVGSFYHVVAQSQHQSRTLAALRDTLLPKLTSGELRVHDTQRFTSMMPE